jgi:hypothetical protein
VIEVMREEGSIRERRAHLRNAAELTMLADMQRAAMIRNEPVDLDGLIRLEGVARRAVADMRQLAREVRVQPSMTIEEHIRATYGQRRDVGLPEIRPYTTPSPRNEPHGEPSRRRVASRGSHDATPPASKVIDSLDDACEHAAARSNENWRPVAMDRDANSVTFTVHDHASS